MAPWKESTRRLRAQPTIQRGGTATIPVAYMKEKRHVFQRVSEKECAGSEDRVKGPDTKSCRTGINVDLFPATTLYVTATLVDQKARHWDPQEKRYVVGPLTSQLFYQIAGRHPDLNKNGVDDYIDIHTGRSKDANNDGVPDEVQRGKKGAVKQPVSSRGF